VPLFFSEKFRMATQQAGTPSRHSARLHSFSLARARHWHLPVLVSLAAFVCLGDLGRRSLYDWDEATYAEVSREMVRYGDWLTPHFGYQPFFDKPPLFMWCTALLFRFFGINEFWARAVPSAEWWWRGVSSPLPRGDSSSR
jgi:predicted membrane-bound mannosyltransferase